MYTLPSNFLMGAKRKFIFLFGKQCVFYMSCWCLVIC